ncbi:MAG TPA: YceH family protein [Pyrinomonadaceae bacterium]|nr:YceH family protein [Pyrinomonadaceae bacterium]
MAVINEIEGRVLGSLVEKQLTTPEYYPLTLNALVAACNQKSNRDPVMSLDATAVLAAIDTLRDKNLVYLFHGSTSRAVKYKHMLPSVYEVDEAGTAVITLLLLRGPQTVGELRGRADRLHEFGSISEVQETLDELARRDEPLVLKLERQPGQKEARFAHLLSGEVDMEKFRSRQEIDLSPAAGGKMHHLEAEVVRLSDELQSLRSEFEQFKSQFS